MRQQLLDFLKEAFPDDFDVEGLLEIPKAEAHGDYALPMFLLSKQLKKPPQGIAQEKAEELARQQPPFLREIRAIGPYLNFFLDTTILFNSLQERVIGEELVPKTTSRQRIVLEYPSPNTNKPLHLGHVRNMLLGKSMALLLQKTGHEVHQVNLNNDRGIAICKSMLAYQKFAEGQTPQEAGMKPDYFVGKWYVTFAKAKDATPELEEEAQELLRRWEEGDPETVELWKMMNRWAIEGFNDTYRRFGISHQKEYHESEIYERGKELVKDALQKGVFKNDEQGNIVADLEEEGLGRKVLLRSDGTSIYVTQDIALAYAKAEDFEADRFIVLTGNEQDHHFRVLFTILERLGFDARTHQHLSYGMISLPEGRMKSREGTVVDADVLLDQVTGLAEENLEQRNPELDRNERRRRAEIIAKGALNFYVLKYNPQADFIYHAKESLAFEGETGPYLQYTYARIRSVLRRGEHEPGCSVGESELPDPALKLLRQLQYYPEIFQEAAEKYKPSTVAHYLISCAQRFNELYQNVPFISKEEPMKQELLELAYLCSQVLRDGLESLGIDVLDEM